MRTCQSLGFVLTMAAAFLLAGGPAQAACTWSFNWYCSNAGCSRTMGRSTGTVDGFASEAACNSARGNWRSKGVDTTGSCNRSGICDAPAAAPSGAPRGGQGGGFTGGGTPMPAYDDEADRLAREQAEATERAAKQKAEQEARLKAEQERKFQQGKQEALGSLKGTGTQDGLELKTPSASGGSPELKTAIEAPRLKQPNPPARESATAANVAALERRVDRIEPPPPWPLDKIGIKHGEWLEYALTGAEGIQQLREMAGYAVEFPKINIVAQVVIFGGKLALAGEKGLRVHVLRQNEFTENALGYLKNENDRQEFIEIVQAIRQNRPIAQTTNTRRADMIQSARAMLDPRNAESYTWGTAVVDLVRTPEAQLAMLNFMAVEVAGKTFGKAVAELDGFRRSRVPLSEEKLQRILSYSWVPVGGKPLSRSSLPVDVKAVEEALATVKAVKGTQDKAYAEAFEALREGNRLLETLKSQYGAGTFMYTSSPLRDSTVKSMIKAEAVIVQAYSAESKNMTEAFAGWLGGKGTEEYLKRRGGLVAQ